VFSNQYSFGYSPLVTSSLSSSSVYGDPAFSSLVSRRILYLWAAIRQAGQLELLSRLNRSKNRLTRGVCSLQLSCTSSSSLKGKILSIEDVLCSVSSARV
jgi:hypothetical protein